MILKTLYLSIGDFGLPTECTYGLLKRSRCLCNFLEREVLKKTLFDADGFCRIVVGLKTSPSEGVVVNTSKVAVVDVRFDKIQYESKNGKDLMSYLVDRLQEGLCKCSRHVRIPLKELLTGIDEFITNGMKNEWTHKTRAFRKHGILANLNCRLTMEEFELSLQIMRDQELIVDKVILRTDPDEIAFEQRYKDIEIHKDQLTVTAKRGDPLWHCSLSDLKLGSVDHK